MNIQKIADSPAHVSLDIAPTAQGDRDILTRGSQSNSLFFNMFCASPEFIGGLALAAYQIVSGVNHILSGVLNLIQVFLAHFWLLLSSVVCRIGSGLRSLVRGFSRFQPWTEAEDQLHDDNTVNPTALSSPKLWQRAQLLLTAFMIGSGIFDLVELFSTGFGWKLLISAVYQIGSGVFDLVPESHRLLQLILKEAKKILYSKARMCRNSLITPDCYASSNSEKRQDSLFQGPDMQRSFHPMII